MSSAGRSTRARTVHNYAQLHNGPAVPGAKASQVATPAWSTTKLYPLEVTDSKTLDGKLFVKVHYTEDEWASNKYDEWREAKDIIDVPDCYIHGAPEQRDFFCRTVKV